MSENCPTVIIATKNGPVVMNESEYDPKVHTLFKEPVKKSAPKKAAK